ncbi:MAG: hydrogenase nickel incorporation protein HypB [Solobacterium sp.]|nr:hydrogenase nickel incorporation protein HypB [Solobacterium sp.]
MINIVETKERITADNEKAAEETKKSLKEKNIFFVNVMASPGAGKTSFLCAILPELKKHYRIGVMEADVDSKVDAETIQQLGVKVIQLHSGGLCHMDADMTARGLESLGLDDLDVIFLENIGNLVCPAEFDTGATLNLMILSVPEGDDKPLKYPLMFQVSDYVLVNKIDTKPIFDFDDAAFEANVKKQNPNAKIYYLSAKTKEGIDPFLEVLINEIESYRERQ